MIELLRRRPGRSLLVVALVAVLLVTLWVRYVTTNTTTTTVAAGQSGTSAGVAWRLDSIRANRGYVNYLGEAETPLAGASFVVVHFTYTVVNAERADCSWAWLQGAGRQWSTAAGSSSTHDGFEMYCKDGGTVELIYEVPTSALPEITGVLISNGPQTQVFLQGRPT